MSSSDTSPSLPAPQQRDSVRFYFAKSLPYSQRLLLALGCFVVGAAIQMATLSAPSGLAFIIVAVLLLIVKGYDSRVRLKTFDIDPAWKPVPIEKIQELEDLRKRAKKWDRDAFEASNPLGCFMLIMCNALIVAVSFVMGALVDSVNVVFILMVDGLIVLWAFWLTGMRRLLKQPNLAVRVRVVLELHERFQGLCREGEVFQPSLKLARGKGTGKGEGTVPVDVRFTVQFPTPPAGFYGLQAQINLNIVQGTSYPYFYCVLAAKPGFGLAKYRDGITLPSKVLCEYQENESAEVLVIRQRTTKKSGYHTDDKACERILTAALEGGRLVCGGSS